MATTKTEPVLEPLTLPPEPPIKSGFTTSEFAVTVATLVSALAAQLSGILPEPWGAIVMAAVTFGYTVLRTVLKIRALPSVGATPNPNS